MDEQMKLALSRYRMSRAEELLSTARGVQKLGDYPSANDRVYYGVFCAIRAVLALDGEDYKRHAQVLGRFNQQYVKTGVFDSDFGRMIYRIAETRHQSDYEDFYVCTQAETEELIQDAARFLKAVRAYLETQRGVSFPN